jgi:DNA-binding transcriptional regulator YiaG
MTQEQFAHEVGVTICTVNRWENARTEPHSLAWKDIAELARRRGLISLPGAAPPSSH